MLQRRMKTKTNTKKMTKNKRKRKRQKKRKKKKLAATLRGSRTGCVIHIAHYDVIDDVITRKL